MISKYHHYCVSTCSSYRIFSKQCSNAFDSRMTTRTSALLNQVRLISSIISTRRCISAHVLLRIRHKISLLSYSDRTTTGSSSSALPHIPGQSHLDLDQSPSLLHLFDFPEKNTNSSITETDNGNEQQSSLIVLAKDGTEDDDTIDVKATSSDLFDAIMQDTLSRDQYIKGPLQTKSAKLDPHYLHSLKILPPDQQELGTSTQKLAAKQLSHTDSLELNGTSSSPAMNRSTLAYFTDLIHINALAKRPMEAQLAFDSIKANGLTPDLISFNQLMNAYAQTKDLKGSLKVYDQIIESGIVPDLVTFSILIKACVAVGDLDSAFRLYTDMKLDHHLMPNEIVYTTLIKGCIKAKELDRAWKTFDHLREQIKQPDHVCYNLMIHACNMNKDAERALDLLEEMKQKGIPCDTVTFTAVLSCCLSRRDYYHDAFGILEQMAGQEIKLNSIMYVILLRGMARYGDFSRGRIVWNDFITDVASEMSLPEVQRSVTLQPQALSSMLSLCGKYLERIRIEEQQQKKEMLPVTEEIESLNHGPSSEPEVRVCTNSAPLIERNEDTTPECVQTVEYEPTTGIPKFNDVNLSPMAIVEWSRALYDFANSTLGMNLTGESPVSQNLKDAYLRVLTQIPSTSDAIEKSFSFFESQCSDRSLRTYSELLSLSQRAPLDMVSRLDNLLQDFEKWYEQRDAKTQAEVMTRVPTEGELREIEKERIRKADGRDKSHIRALFIGIAKAFARAHEFEKAMDTIERAHQFQYSSYLDPIRLHEIPSVVDGANQLSLSGDWTLSKRLAKLCSMATLTPFEQGAITLRNRTSPQAWVGIKTPPAFDSSSQSRSTLAKKEKQRVKSYVMSKKKITQKKSHQIRVFPGVVDLRNKSD